MHMLSLPAHSRDPATQPPRREGEGIKLEECSRGTLPLSTYAPAMRCPVLTCAMMLPASILSTCYAVFGTDVCYAAPRSVRTTARSATTATSA
eukprot:3356711-Rhodomonas_salina.1